MTMEFSELCHILSSISAVSYCSLSGDFETLVTPFSLYRDLASFACSFFFNSSSSLSTYYHHYHHLDITVLKTTITSTSIGIFFQISNVIVIQYLLLNYQSFSLILDFLQNGPVD